MWWWVRDEWHSVSEGFAWGAVTKPLMADWWFTSTRKNNEKKKNENDGAIPFHYNCRFFIIRQLRKLESGKKRGKKWRMRLNVESFDFQTFSRIRMIWAFISRRNFFFSFFTWSICSLAFVKGRQMEMSSTATGDFNRVHCSATQSHVTLRRRNTAPILTRPNLCTKRQT